MGAADLEVVDGIGSVNVTLVELPEDLLKKQLGEAFCDLLFLIATSQSKRSPLVEGFRRPSLRSGLLNPSTKGVRSAIYPIMQSGEVSCPFCVRSFFRNFETHINKVNFPCTAIITFF